MCGSHFEIGRNLMRVSDWGVDAAMYGEMVTVTVTVKECLDGYLLLNFEKCFFLAK